MNDQAWVAKVAQQPLVVEVVDLCLIRSPSIGTGPERKIWPRAKSSRYRPVIARPRSPMSLTHPGRRSGRPKGP